MAAHRVVFATGYRADLTKVPYLAGVLGQVKVAHGFPVLDDAFQTSLAGLYITGFSATQDFGPFFGFVRGSPAAATLITRDLLSRNPQAIGTPVPAGALGGNPATTVPHGHAVHGEATCKIDIARCRL